LYAKRREENDEMTHTQVGAKAPRGTSGDWRSDALGPARTLDVRGGRMRAHVTGEGPAIVFVHGALVNANLWRGVVSRLDGFTRVTLDMPLGSHLEPLPNADLTPLGLAGLIGDAVSALGLSDVTLIGNDTGGGICQIAAGKRPAWLGGLALTSCDAFDNFPPRFFQVVLAPARVPALVPILFGALRVRALRRLPIAYGWLTNKAPEPAVDDSYVLPILTNAGVRRDFARVLRGLSPTYTEAAARELREFDRPVLLAWARNDRFFPPEHAERLAATIPGARLEWLDQARSLVPEDEPERLAELIASFVRERTPA
jgi:pimeloyl-ACP methyl ester carboxylesterase